MRWGNSIHGFLSFVGFFALRGEKTYKEEKYHAAAGKNSMVAIT
jgi:hypothetical protein